MGIIRLWESVGATISADPARSLAALLGHRQSAMTLSDARLTSPDMEQMAQEIEVNPHKLDLPQEYLRTRLLVRALALWGWEPLTRASIACAEIQIANQTHCEPSLVKIRDAARIAAEAFASCPDATHRKSAEEAADACRRLYKPYEDDPDSDDAGKVWYQLGAPWFAAETAAQDFSLTQWDGPGPTGASATWGNRNSVWPERAADAAAHWSSQPKVRMAINNALVEWAVAHAG
jgi:hypothetical protein